MDGAFVVMFPMFSFAFISVGVDIIFWDRGCGSVGVWIIAMFV